MPLSAKCLVSACLAGLCTRYDGRSKPDRTCLALLEKMDWLPVCPEQLGGLPTPRTPADMYMKARLFPCLTTATFTPFVVPASGMRVTGGDGHDVLAGRAAVIDRNGVDVSKQFILGARQVLAIARAQNINLALLKSGSPSCGVSGRPGVTAALLQEHGIECREFG